MFRLTVLLLNSMSKLIRNRYTCKLNRKFKADFQSVLHTLESLFTTFVLFHVRRHKQ